MIENIYSSCCLYASPPPREVVSCRRWSLQAVPLFNLSKLQYNFGNSPGPQLGDILEQWRFEGTHLYQTTADALLPPKWEMD